MPESDPELGDSEQSSRQRSPQTDKKKSPGAGSDDFRDGRTRGAAQISNPMIEQRGTRKQPKEQQAPAGPTVRKRRK